MLTKTTPRRFKNVENVSIPLGRVNVLVGINNSGKSSVLQGIAFAVSVAQTVKVLGWGKYAVTGAADLRAASRRVCARPRWRSAPVKGQGCVFRRSRSPSPVLSRSVIPVKPITYRSVATRGCDYVWG